jgi:TolB-like protein/Tfp pilus assembly protein PilF
LSESPSGAVFLSYAKQDSEAARRICAALQAAGIEVWFDQSDLRGGDVWDQKIRQQIRDCALFVPVISTRTQERLEGYFRREWRLAVDRTHDMASRMAFLVPVVIDATTERDAEVPDEFRKVQWTHLPDGETTPAFAQRVSALLASRSAPARPVRTPPAVVIDPPHAPLPVVAPRRSTLALVVFAVLAVCAIGYLGWREVVPSEPTTPQITSAPPPPSTPSPVADIPDKSVAVLPFVNMSSDKEQEYFSDGLSDELIQLLANVPDLRVPGRTSSFYFKGKNETIETISKQLRVANLLEGSVRKAGDRLRVTADLVRADNGYHLWSETYDRDAKDIFKVQDEIAAAVITALKATLALSPKVSSRRTSSADAYNQFLLGRQFYNRSNADGFTRAVAAYGQAIALDPNYAAAYAGLADAEDNLADWTGDASGLRRAEGAADTAIALAPDEADGYSARGSQRIYHIWDWAGAQADFTKALTLDPADSLLLRAYGIMLGYLGRLPEAITAIKKSIAIDPLSSRGWEALGTFLLAEKDFPATHEALRRALEIQPDDALSLNRLAVLQLLEGKAGDALSTYRKIDDDGFRLYGIAMTEHTLGDSKASQQALDEAITKHAQDSAYQIAEAQAWRGEKNDAFDWLERAYRQRDGGLAETKIDPLLENLHGDPRYQAILRKLNLPE